MKRLLLWIPKEFNQSHNYTTHTTFIFPWDVRVIPLIGLYFPFVQFPDAEQGLVKPMWDTQTYQVTEKRSKAVRMKITVFF